ncbi:rab family small GTPase [Naegleria gruberi]|uniref:Rab family small GTPase n=1 Tax=Naegleria gruberi TaxID=5762 RepID=D2UZR9_NAEGR|nr:rab family small GTPase [Naegleria gruberi]EFC49984.1 rab family small GTPase [Naegleria gruberi]|eukprot:XP_002682728.1 rab family small GTPase [Naegleria gruberi strain NEG-M]
MNQSNAYHYMFKFIIIGDSGVGKSCILLQFTDDRFDARSECTIGVEFGTKTIDLGSKYNHLKIKTQIWDTAGQEGNYYRGSACAFLVYDITRRSTFQSVQTWLTDALSNSSNHSQLVVVLVGNKSDLKSQRQVSYKEGLEFAEKNNIHIFMETSAKTAENIHKSFYESAEIIYRKVLNHEIMVGFDDDVVGSGVKGGVLLANQQSNMSTTPSNTNRVRGSDLANQTSPQKTEKKEGCCGGK